MRVQVQVMGATIESHVEPVVDQGVLMESGAETQLGEQVDADVLEDPGAHPPFDVGAGAVLHDHGIDALKMQHMAQSEACRPRSDDGDVAAQPGSSSCIGDRLGRSLGASIIAATLR